MTERLAAFPVFEVDGARVWIDQVRPVAVIDRDSHRTVVRWGDVFTGWAEPAVAAVAGPAAVWVHYGLLNSVDSDEPLASAVNDVDAPAVHIDIYSGTTTVVRVGRDHVLGATRHGLWTTRRIPPDPDFTNPYFGGPLPADWHDDTVVTVRGPDGSAQTVVVDRPVLAVEESDRQIRLLVRPTPPVSIPEAGYCRRRVKTDPYASGEV